MGLVSLTPDVVLHATSDWAFPLDCPNDLLLERASRGLCVLGFSPAPDSR